MTLGLALAVNAQTQRISLFEEWTGENCPPCASTNPAITTLAHANISPTMKVILLRYQVAIPSAPTAANSLYVQNPTEPSNRQDYYYPVGGDQFAPQGRMNGEELGQGTASQGHAGYFSQTAINNAYQVDAPFALTTGYAWNATFDSITITTNITAAQAFTTTNPMKLHLAICEEEIHYVTAPGTNGEKDFEYIMRKMVPNENGTTIAQTWTNGQTQTFTNKVKLPTYIFNKGEVTVVAFIQEDKPNPGPNTKRDIHQAAYGAPQPLALDASISSVSGVVPASCSTTFTPTAVITNSGVTTLTSCTVNYKIDNGTVNSINWTGSLTTGQTDVINLPLQNSATGAHTFYVYTSQPNGGTDNNLNNDQKGIGYAIYSSPSGTPVAEGFLTTTFPPANWIELNPDGGSANWSRVAAGNPTGSAKYDYYNNANNGDLDDLVLPTMDFSANSNPVMTFSLAYNYYTDASGSFYDSLAVEASDDCGATWTRLYYTGGQNMAFTGATGASTAYTPSTAQWRTETVSLSAYANKPSVVVKFVAINYYGNNGYVDNVNISTVGINQLPNTISTVNVYPNPAVNSANVVLNMTEKDEVTISVLNALGQEMFNSKNEMMLGENRVAINTENFASGIYNVIISTSKGSKIEKLSVSK